MHIFVRNAKSSWVIMCLSTWIKSGVRNRSKKNLQREKTQGLLANSLWWMKGRHPKMSSFTQKVVDQGQKWGRKRKWWDDGLGWEKLICSYIGKQRFYRSLEYVVKLDQRSRLVRLIGSYQHWNNSWSQDGKNFSWRSTETEDQNRSNVGKARIRGLEEK